MDVVKKALCGLALLTLAACGGTSAPASASTTTTSKVPATTASKAGSTAQAKATVSGDGLLFVGADTAKVGDTIKVTVMNETSGQLDVKLLDASGQTAAQVQVAGKATGDISAAATSAGSWKITFTGTAIGSGLDKTITVK
jgi:flagellar basal body L-ring protein FlgH